MHLELVLKEKFRDEAVARVQSAEGLTWTDYKVRVKGYSLDAQVKFIRLLGASPETSVCKLFQVSYQFNRFSLHLLI